MERLLHYVWKYRLYPSDTLTTTDGTQITIIDPGTPNTDAGPDFFNAKIRVEDTVWAGSVEIHDRSSDWQRHHHDGNKAYDAVILHVTGEADHPVLRSTGEPIPQLVLEVPEHIRRNIDWLLHNEKYLPCLRAISQIEPFHISAWLSVLLSERLERKVRDITQLLEQYQYDWNEVFYIMLTRNFGFGVNGDAFEWLAKSLPLRHLQKQRHSHSQIEAMLFGQAGLLLDESEDHYYHLLQREYQFLQKKYHLKPLDNSLFKRLRIRPNSFPHVKIAQLSAVWVKYDTLFSLLREAKTPGEIKRYFQVAPSEY
ncbi:DUF2851 family protein, partial [Parabacteroides sp. OttesenSCG-928-N08]|nr:DUF2851 family protein [Parabacteroides sp. OttesenSCG-928-N08]